MVSPSVNLPFSDQCFFGHIPPNLIMIALTLVFNPNTGRTVGTYAFFRRLILMATQAAALLQQ